MKQVDYDDVDDIKKSVCVCVYVYSQASIFAFFRVVRAHRPICLNACVHH